MSIVICSNGCGRYDDAATNECPKCIGTTKENKENTMNRRKRVEVEQTAPVKVNTVTESEHPMKVEAVKPKQVNKISFDIRVTLSKVLSFIVVGLSFVYGYMYQDVGVVTVGMGVGSGLMAAKAVSEGIRK